MHEPDFWSHSAEAMELSIEGNRLIAAELAEMLAGLWQRATRWFDGLVQGTGRRQQLPPM
jgi:hypothetical protein